jgi:hypothetical protein
LFGQTSGRAGGRDQREGPLGEGGERPAARRAAGEADTKAA